LTIKGNDGTVVQFYDKQSDTSTSTTTEPENRKLYYDYIPKATIKSLLANPGSPVASYAENVKSAFPEEQRPADVKLITKIRNLISHQQNLQTDHVTNNGTIRQSMESRGFAPNNL
jgi:hypothetical protein